MDAPFLVSLISLALAGLMFLLAILNWIWPTADQFWKKVSPFAPRIIRYLLFLFLGFTLGALITGLIFRYKSAGNLNSIKSIPLSAYAYGAVNDPNIGQGTAVLSIIQSPDYEFSYNLQYTLPQEGDGYAGVNFQFSEFQDFSPFEFIEIVISFEDIQAKCALAITDSSGNADYLVLGEPIPMGVDVEDNIDGNQHSIKIPLEPNFKELNLKSIKMIAFNADSYYTHGTHSFVVNDVKFVKP